MKCRICKRRMVGMTKFYHYSPRAARRLAKQGRTPRLIRRNVCPRCSGEESEAITAFKRAKASMAVFETAKARFLKDAERLERYVEERKRKERERLDKLFGPMT